MAGNCRRGGALKQATGMASLAEYIKPVAPHFTPHLIAAESIHDMLRVASVLPGALAYGLFGFECRLGDSAPLADLLVCARAADGGRDALLELDSGLHEPAWQRVREFAAEWSDSSGPLYDGVDYVWLEFDVAGNGGSVPQPSVFFGVDTHQDQSIVEQGLELPLGRALPEYVANNLRACMAALPSDARVAFVGAMLSRDVNSVRLVSSAPSFEQILTYLTRVGWPGSVQEFRHSLEPFSRMSDYVWLNVDVGVSVHPRIGLEFYFFRPAHADGAAHWHTILDRMVHVGLCTPKKRDALLAYPGSSPVDVQSDLWPDHVGVVFNALRPLGLTGMLRDLHHLKFVYEPDGSIQAKAYLSAAYR
jgi:hypothetical protein